MVKGAINKERKGLFAGQDIFGGEQEEVLLFRSPLLSAGDGEGPCDRLRSWGLTREFQTG